jgi:hypothetical protein
MTAADFQLTMTALTPIVVAVCGTITAIYAAKAHSAASASLAQGHANAAKIDAVQTTVDGAQHLLASNLASSQAANEETLRTLAASTITKPPPEAP